MLNAGISKAARIADYTVEDFDNLFATNVRSPFFLVQQLLPILGDGSNIVLISSAVARTVVGKPGLENTSILAYASTKGAVETLAKHWAAILGPSGIRVNAVAPGVIYTDMSNFTKTEAGREVTLGMQALKRIGKPEDVADVVAFCGVRWSALDHRCEHSSGRRLEAVTSRREEHNGDKDEQRQGDQNSWTGPSHYDFAG